MGEVRRRQAGTGITTPEALLEASGRRGERARSTKAVERGASSEPRGGGADEAHDARSIALLLVLYTLQGVPMGLSGAVPLLLAGKTSYKAQSLFSLASLPFSLKLLWAPFVDAAYVPRFGKRKTWLVPTQLLIGVAMVRGRDRIESWMTGEPNVEALTAFFFALYFLCATPSTGGR